MSSTWSGNGDITPVLQNTCQAGSLASRRNNSGRYVFSTTASQFILAIAAVGSPHVTDLQVFHANDETALASGQVFSQQFIARLKQANFGVIRFLNWQMGNTTNVTTWATRKPISYVFYAGTEMRPGLYAGTTSLAGNAYSVAMPGFSLTDKATIIVKFNASYNGPCTLNVSGTGNINILNETCGQLSATQTVSPSLENLAKFRLFSLYTTRSALGSSRAAISRQVAQDSIMVAHLS